MHRYNGINISLLALIAMGTQLTLPAAQARADEPVVYINSSGGTLDEANRKIYWDPFTKETGIKVIDSAPADAAKLKAMVDSGNVLWDIAEVDGGDYSRLADAGYLEKLDASKLPAEDITKEGLAESGIWINVYSTTLTWDLKRWPMSGKHPTSIKDLWNQKDFPGPRCLGKYALDNLEFGSYMAGKTAKDMYPIDEKAALAELDKLKSDVAVWWTSGAQSVQAIADGECVMGTTYNGRPYQLSQTGDAKLGVAWGGGVVHAAWWVIPKGAKNRENALKLLAYMQDPKRQAEMAKSSGYVGPNKKTTALLDPAVAPFVSNTPDNLKEQIMVNEEWWAKNGPEAEQKFLGWLMQ